MHNCLLCRFCKNDSDDEYGLTSYYVCYKRELDGDNRFPYKKTKCKHYENDTSATNLTLKNIDKELMKSINWEIICD